MIGKGSNQQSGVRSRAGLVSFAIIFLFHEHHIANGRVALDAQLARCHESKGNTDQFGTELAAPELFALSSFEQFGPVCEM